MTQAQINKESSWPVILTAIRQMRERGPTGVPSSVFSALAERVRSAIEASDRGRLAEASSELEGFYQQLLKLASPESRGAAQGNVSDDGSLGAYLLGQAAFAHLLAAQALDRRADDRFLRAVTDGRYERYVRALFREPMNGTRLEEEIGERKETVSRKLGVLRRLGVVVSRKEGTSVVNNLSLAARGLLEHLRIAPLGGRRKLTPEVEKAVAKKHEKLADYLRVPVSFARAAEGGRRHRATKVA